MQSLLCTGTILNTDFRSTLAKKAPLPSFERIHVASSTEVQCREKSSLAMPSLMVQPDGANIMVDHAPFFLGTTPTPEYLRFSSGGISNGPKMRPASHSLANSSSII